MGDLIAAPERGLVYGNRGCLHDAHGDIRRSWAVKRWIACRLQFRGRHRTPLMQPGRFTELFFLDEATAFAAMTGRRGSWWARSWSGGRPGGISIVGRVRWRSRRSC